MAEYGIPFQFNHRHRQQQSLIPCIPDEIATECLVRIPHRFHSTLRLVSHAWCSLLSDHQFYSQRLRSGSAEHLLFLLHPTSISPPSSDMEIDEIAGLPVSEKTQLQRRICGPPEYSLGVFNLTRREWYRLAMSEQNGLSAGEVRIPKFCQVVALPVQKKILLLGGWDPDTLEPVDDVYVIDLVGGTWRRGSPMKAARSFFAVAVAGGRVYVAGGHDGQKNALKSAEVYDVVADEWVTLPLMAEERDECLGMGFEGGFLVVSGYGTDSQGRFREDAEWYDPETCEWKRMEGIWPFSAVSPRSTAVGGRRWWVAAAEGGEEVREFDWEEKRWRAGRKIPVAGGLSLVDIGGDGRFMVMGEGVFVVEGEGSVCMKVETPPELMGLPFSTSQLLI